MIHRSERFGFHTIEHEADLCVIGAGAAGLFAAVAAARHGAKVVVMHDRPVVGGNASSEVRMWIRGAHGRNNMETGIVEELALRNLRRNPTLNFSIWDSVTYEIMKSEPNIELLLNCSCLDAEMNGDWIESVKGWQTTTQQFHTVHAKLFADCSGDSVLAPLTGAEFRMGRESCDEFGEDIAPVESDSHTMGMSCLLQIRETDHEVKYQAPDWAVKFTDETIGHRVNPTKPNFFPRDNYWWIELGGMFDSIADTEKMRDELLPITFGVWDYYKNSGHFHSANWELDWVGFLPGKRESRRYVGDHILTQNEVRAEGRFDDIVAYGGWSMDDHDPEGFRTASRPTTFHPAPSPFGIPYRCLYSINIDNLMFAGRNISCTHTAMSSCRVMATCATLGQAMGTAAAIAIREGITPRGVYEKFVPELQQTLMEDDCWIPFHHRGIGKVMKGIEANADGKDAAVLFDGYDRPDSTEGRETAEKSAEYKAAVEAAKANGHTVTADENAHLLRFAMNGKLEMTLPEPRSISRIGFIFDSDINRDSMTDSNSMITEIVKRYPMRCNRWLNEIPLTLPATLMRNFTVEIDKGDGVYQSVAEVSDNFRRLWTLDGDFTVKKIRFTPKSSWGTEEARIWSVYLK